MEPERSVMEKKSTMLKESREFILEAYGKNKAEAFGKAFGQLQKKVYKEVQGLVIHMEPEELEVLEEREQTRVEKLIGFFRPRQIEHYYVKFQITVQLKYIPM